ncbi:MAG: hypothetical protein ABIR32_04110 [Ilumatobacteraceae bacterium]
MTVDDAAFARQADRALDRGVIQGYVERDDELAVVRGRMRYREQVTRCFGQITPLLVRYDDSTIDVAENQRLRSSMPNTRPRSWPTARRSVCR